MKTQINGLKYNTEKSELVAEFDGVKIYRKRVGFEFFGLYPHDVIIPLSDEEAEEILGTDRFQELTKLKQTKDGFGGVAISAEHSDKLKAYAKRHNTTIKALFHEWVDSLY